MRAGSQVCWFQLMLKMPGIRTIRGQVWITCLSVTITCCIGLQALKACLEAGSITQTMLLGCIEQSQPFVPVSLNILKSFVWWEAQNGCVSKKVETKCHLISMQPIVGPSIIMLVRQHGIFHVYAQPLRCRLCKTAASEVIECNPRQQQHFPRSGSQSTQMCLAVPCPAYLSRFYVVLLLGAVKPCRALAAASALYS